MSDEGADLLPQRLLRRHVGAGAEHHPGSGQRLLVGSALLLGEPCQSEVEHADVVIRADHDVGRLEVAVDHASVVGIRQGARHLGEDPGHPTGGQRSLGDQVVEGLPAHQRHDQERELFPGAGVRSADVVDADDVRVLEAPHGPRLPLESTLRRGIGDQQRRQYLDRHVPLQPLVARDPHRAHPPARHLLHEAIPPHQHSGLELGHHEAMISRSPARSRSEEDQSGSGRSGNRAAFQDRVGTGSGRDLRVTGRQQVVGAGTATAPGRR